MGSSAGNMTEPNAPQRLRKTPQQRQKRPTRHSAEMDNGTPSLKLMTPDPSPTYRPPGTQTQHLIDRNPTAIVRQRTQSGSTAQEDTGGGMKQEEISTQQYLGIGNSSTCRVTAVGFLSSMEQMTSTQYQSFFVRNQLTTSKERNWG